ncbi:hypothetical protein [Streptomyces sp. NPDC052127]|uniref:hypothetical protein n=1 Tax=Streptomyces sp. NPDC052127 TaxID=3155679 RepID=UPI003430B597
MIYSLAITACKCFVGGVATRAGTISFDAAQKFAKGWLKNHPEVIRNLVTAAAALGTALVTSVTAIAAFIAAHALLIAGAVVVIVAGVVIFKVMTAEA